MSSRTSTATASSSSTRTVSDGDISLHTMPEDPLTEGEILRKPWKYIGYQGYARFIASENDLFLDELDTTHSRKDCEDVSNGTFRNDEVDDRRMVVTEIAKRLHRYTPEEQNYLDHKEDLICVIQRSKTPLRRLIDKSQRLRTLSIWRNKTKTPAETDAQHVFYYSDKRIDEFASGIIVFVGVVMLITPIWILQATKTLQVKLAVNTVFIFAFLLLLSFSMASKPFEALGATAAYAAILMVFIQFGTA
ncbi:hypothetical protein B0J13DRAFT_589995 [Dactylonectria estremocensis]|uniref:DUF6594 domain-containing protein n=1 Tax=Dactylonectria estremocensis TaxID=1079267 RepID=A0A9P9DFP2_9HYPO|nr:hypothetical protein B0J13DRAFT_589995 [Dactylonectria estremocensis]